MSAVEAYQLFISRRQVLRCRKIKPPVWGHKKYTGTQHDSQIRVLSVKPRPCPPFLSHISDLWIKEPLDHCRVGMKLLSFWTFQGQGTNFACIVSFLLHSYLARNMLIPILKQRTSQKDWFAPRYVSNDRSRIGTLIFLIIELVNPLKPNKPNG